MGLQHYTQDMSNLFAGNEQVYQTASLSDIPDILTAENSIPLLKEGENKLE